jgi:hypothetical protein
MSFDRPKFRELLLNAAWKLREEPEGGATVLNKVLYYAEFGHRRQFGETITGARYFRLPDGPAPRALKPVRDELIAEGAARLVPTTFNGFTQDRLIPTAEPPHDLLDDAALQSLDEALILLKGKTARQASDMSHEELGWRFVDDYEDIPPETAFLATRVMVTDVMRSQARQLAKS